jgi:hypothetical protein
MIAMSEKEKAKPKGRPAGSFLTPEDSASFLYETPASIEEVIQRLTHFERIEDDVKHAIELSPVPLGYEFRYTIVSPGVMRPRLSAYAEGRLWQNAREQTVIDGTIHVAISNQDIVIVTAMSLLPIPFLLLLPFTLFSVMTQRADARKIKSNIEQVAAQFAAQFEPSSDAYESRQ